MGLVHKKQKWRGQWVERFFQVEDTKLSYKYPMNKGTSSDKKPSVYTFDANSSVEEGMDGPEGLRCMRVLVQKEEMLVKPLQDDPQQFRDWYVSVFIAANLLPAYPLSNCRFNAFAKAIELAKSQAGQAAPNGVGAPVPNGMPLSPGAPTMTVDQIPDAATGAEAQQIQQNIVSGIQGIRPDGVGPFGQHCMGYGQCGADQTETKAKEFYDFLLNTFGPEFTKSMLPQLVRLLPAKEKRECLLKHGGFLAPPPAPAPVAPAPAPVFAPPPPSPAAAAAAASLFADDKPPVAAANSLFDEPTPAPAPASPFPPAAPASAGLFDLPAPAPAPAPEPAPAPAPALLTADQVPTAAAGAEAQQIQQNVVSGIQGIKPDGVGPFGQQCMGFGQCGVDQTEAKAKEFYDFLMNTFGPEFTKSMLPQLVRLLPDPKKRVALYVAAGLAAP
jgi:hypothetical protein